MIDAIIAFVVINTAAIMGGHSVDHNKHVLEHTQKQVQASGSLDTSMTASKEVQIREEARILTTLEGDAK
jgi:hypothetical protein